MNTCEWEDLSRFQWVWVATVPRAQKRVPFAVCRWSARGFVADCPYPARCCRAKSEAEP